MSIEAMKQWLAAIERANALDGMYSWQDEEDSLRQAIAEAEKQEQGEPVAWGMQNDDGNIYDCITPEEHEREEGEYTAPLYTTPQQRTWVGLTDEDKRYLNEVLNLQGRFHVIDAIEAKLKEKNT